jgi:hypothetical protein
MRFLFPVGRGQSEQSALFAVRVLAPPQVMLFESQPLKQASGTEVIFVGISDHTAEMQCAERMRQHGAGGFMSKSLAPMRLGKFETKVDVVALPLFILVEFPFKFRKFYPPEPGAIVSEFDNPPSQMPTILRKSNLGFRVLQCFISLKWPGMYKLHYFRVAIQVSQELLVVRPQSPDEQSSGLKSEWYWFFDFGFANEKHY